MKKTVIFIITFSLLFIFSIQDCFSGPGKEIINQNISQDFPDEIIFYTTGSSFSPVLTLQADAEVIWTWDDSTTSNSLTPVKNYGSDQVRTNRLKVTPWSAVRRINIGYDAGDDGSPDIELVANQRVSGVENLHLVAPYLKEWCSSYNKITHLDFSNFTELETIECYFSMSLESVNLTNTNKLKRASFDWNNLQTLDVSDSPLLGDLRAAANAFSTITLSDQTDSLWHICVHSNQLTDPHFFNDMSRFPNLADLLINFSYQEGELVIPQTNLIRDVEIRAYGNKYTSIDFRGAFQNRGYWGIVNMNHNEISEVNIAGCVQIKVLDLSNNKLTSAEIDDVLKQMDELGTDPQNGTIDLRNNQPPTYTGWVHKTNLENKGWTVYTDLYVPVESITVTSDNGTTISTDDGTLQLQADILPADVTAITVNWSVSNETGKANITSTGLLTAEKDGTVRAVASATDGSGVTGELQITISNQTILIETLEIISNIPGDTISGIGKQVQFDVILTPSDATNQNIDWSVENISGEAIIDSTGLLTTQYPGRIKVIAKATDESNNTSTKEYLIVIPVGIKLNSNQSGVKIFPNPTEGEIKIQIDRISHQGANIEIWDFSGQLLMKKKVFEKFSYFSLEKFGGNSFLIIVNTKNELTVQKVIKN